MKQYTFEKIAGIQPSKGYLRNPKYQFEKIAAGIASSWTRMPFSPPIKENSLPDYLQNQLNNMPDPSVDREPITDGPVATTPTAAPAPYTLTAKKRQLASANTQRPNKPTPMNLLPDNNIPNAQPSVDLATGDGRDAAAAVSNALEMTPQQEQANHQYFGTGPYSKKMWGRGVDPHYYEARPNGTATGAAFLPNGKKLSPAEANRRRAVNGQLNDVSPEQAKANGRAFNIRTGVPWRKPSRAGLPFSPQEAAEEHSRNILRQARSPEDYNRIAGVLNSDPRARSLYPEGQKSGFDAMRRNGVQIPYMPIQTTTEMLAFAPNPTNNIEIADSRIRNQRILGQQRMDARADALITQQAREREQERIANQRMMENWGRLSPGQLRRMGFDDPEEWYSMTPEQHRQWFKQRQDKRLADTKWNLQNQFSNSANAINGDYSDMQDFQKYKRQQEALWGKKWRANGRTQEEIDDYINRTYKHRLENYGVNMTAKVPNMSRAFANMPRPIAGPTVSSLDEATRANLSNIPDVKEPRVKSPAKRPKLMSRVKPIVNTVTGAVQNGLSQLGNLFFQPDEEQPEQAASKSISNPSSTYRPRTPNSAGEDNYPIFPEDM